MPYWDETDNENDRLGYSKDDDGRVTKYSRLNDYYDSDHNKNDDHAHEFIDTSTGIYGSRGENYDRSDFRREFDSAKFNKK